MSDLFRIEVNARPEPAAAPDAALLHDIAALGIRGVRSVTTSDLFFIQGDLDESSARYLADRLLHDPLSHTVSITRLPEPDPGEPPDSTHSVEVAFHPGVTDSVAETLLGAASVLGLGGIRQAATARRFILQGELSRAALAEIARGLLANLTIQSFSIDRPIDPPFVQTAAAATLEVIPLVQATAQNLMALSRDRRLALDLAEMRAIQDYFRRASREPTDVELEMLAQTWSEHCVHKTFKATIDYVDASQVDAPPLRIDGLLDTYIRAATERLARPWVVSAFVDNAGIIRFDERFDLAFKVETHNHPSALEPFGGANTGVGGVVRDILGVSARPIANTDILCFGPAGLPFDRVPSGVLHPRRTRAGVVHGIEDYGNKMGIPTVNGAVVYHEGYTANPLVYCGCLGILPHGTHRSLHEAQPGDLVVVIGGRTGRDGLRGATFSSMEMSHETGQVAGSAVQIGHPIHEKQVLEVLLAARDEGLYHAVTDCGAGGLSSAVGEMASTLGADVELDRVPLKYAGLQPWEIWLSEAQERMVLAIPESNWPRFRGLCLRHGVEAVDLGRFSGDARLLVRFAGRPVAELDVDFLHNGLPQRHLEAVWTPPAHQPLEVPEPTGSGLGAWLLRLLAHPNVASKEALVRRYDHEVQGGTLVRPFVGARADGPGDAAVLVPLDTVLAALENSTDALEIDALPAVALGAGINPAYGRLDPYAMAWAAIDEALRNVVAVGADPDRTAILDNFCWGNPLLPDRLGGLVRCAQGCYDAALAYGTPFISGKDSLNNEYVGLDGRQYAIPGTLLISAVGIVPDSGQTVTMDVKEAGNLLYVHGETTADLGGGLYYQFQGQTGGSAPRPPRRPLARLQALHRAMRAGLVRACHDCSEGGLGVAVAEMALAGRFGVTLDLADIPLAAEHPHEVAQLSRPDSRLFAETCGRFVVEVRPGDAARFEAVLADAVPLACCGQVTETSRLAIHDGQRPLFDVSLDDLLAAWKSEETT